MEIEDLSGDSLNNIPRGAQSGEEGGLRVILDAESFAFNDEEKHSDGF
jgi:hypothetical protein